ncbi:MAG: hypothetical protein JJV98_08860, partial [Desulfosarcina sp.]|nr:hypothetical protein [Desulfobacterales bacterium]
MYLAVIRQKQCYQFVIRESYWDRDCYRNRDLVDLGADPSRHIVYPGGRAYYIDPELEDRILDRGGAFDADALEELFWPFVDEDIRYAVDAFRKRWQPPERPAGPGTHNSVHLFDKRRIPFRR